MVGQNNFENVIFFLWQICLNLKAIDRLGIVSERQFFQRDVFFFNRTPSSDSRKTEGRMGSARVI